jgi:UDP-N-acetylglucosamine 1-carboxyvinyltransferase
MNKKTVLAAAVGAVLIAGWAGATYTTGQKLKTALLAQTEGWKSQPGQPQRAFRVTDVQYSSGLLGATRTLTLAIGCEAETTTLTWRDDIRHGPLPGFAGFGAARIENDVQGCTLGVREIDPHVEVMERFGATVERRREALVMRTADGGLKANAHWLDYASVTTTENFVLCAALAQGTSTLMNAASEPHVQEFCQFMAMLGARIEGLGTSRLVVEGVSELGGGEFTFAEDFHEIVTFLALGAITGGRVEVKNSTPEQFPLIDRTFAKFGAQVVHEGGWSHATAAGPLRVREPVTRNLLQKVEAAPWPYLPVDLLPIFVALGVKAEGH